MAKRFKMNLTTRDLSALGGTDSLHPASFPLGSIESRAAASDDPAGSNARWRPGNRSGRLVVVRREQRRNRWRDTDYFPERFLGRDAKIARDKKSIREPNQGVVS